mmetsp:Transcript_50779/g.91203  ORF Transcript_50779/g.91203 Transcript_50779/m.91203 type:complete len:276 (-) Transcript_50779:74-901(-)
MAHSDASAEASFICCQNGSCTVHRFNLAAAYAASALSQDLLLGMSDCLWTDAARELELRPSMLSKCHVCCISGCPTAQGPPVIAAPCGMRDAMTEDGREVELAELTCRFTAAAEASNAVAAASIALLCSPLPDQDTALISLSFCSWKFSAVHLPFTTGLWVQLASWLCGDAEGRLLLGGRRHNGASSCATQASASRSSGHLCRQQLKAAGPLHCKRGELNLGFRPGDSAERSAVARSRSRASHTAWCGVSDRTLRRQANHLSLLVPPEAAVPSMG